MGGGEGRKGKPAGEGLVIYIKQDLPASKELTGPEVKGCGWELRVRDASRAARLRRPDARPRVESGVVVFFFFASGPPRRPGPALP